jgi:hypothetical protein
MVDQTSEQDEQRNDLPLGVCVYRIGQGCTVRRNAV